jgi:hypothetical protein
MEPSFAQAAEEGKPRASTSQIAELAKITAEAQALLASGKPLAALSALQPLEPQFSGNPTFDYLLAICYLDSNQPTRAIFALERVLAVSPDSTLAQAELARAHMALGEVDTAARLATALAQDSRVPMDARRSLDALALIARGLPVQDRGKRALADRAEAFQLGGRGGLAFGYDSNVSAATSLTTLSIPSLADLGLAQIPESARARQAFGVVAIGELNAVQPLTPDLAVTGGAGVERHGNVNESDFDLTTLDAHAGLAGATKMGTPAARLSVQQAWIGTNSARLAYGLSGDFRFEPWGPASLTTFAQVYRLDYPREAERNVWRYATGISGELRLNLWDKPSGVFGSLAVGQERASSPYPFFGHQFVATRVGLVSALTQKLGASLSIGLERRHYGGIEPLFDVKRRDRQVDGRVLLTYDIGNQWSMTVDGTWMRVRSTVGLNDYSRASALIGLVKAF